MVTLSRPLKLWRISGDESTMHSKQGGSSNKLALDHLFINDASLDYGIEACVTKDVWLSDLYPLQATWQIPKVSACLELAQTDVLQRRSQREWNFHATTYIQWAENAVHWLAESFQQTPQSKTRVTADQPHKKVIYVDHTYTRLRSAQKETHKLQTRQHETPSHLLRRRMRALMLACPDTVSLARHVLDRALNDYLDFVKNTATKTWKSRVKGWGVQSANLYRFLKNPEPAKALVLKKGEDQVEVMSDVREMDRILTSFWSRLESWESESQLHEFLRLRMTTTRCIYQIIPLIPDSLPKTLDANCS